MAGTKMVKQMLIERDVSVGELAACLEINPQSLSNKLYRDSFSFEEMLKITDYLGCDIKIIARDTKKEF